jgi:hypothetical protein
LLIENYRWSGLVTALVVFVIVAVGDVTERPGDQTQDHEDGESNQA